MRKYNNKTKRTIMIIAILFVVFTIIFSLFLKRSIDVAKAAYTVDIGSILFDNEENMITTTTESSIKMKWAGNYYLTEEDKRYNLGNHSVVYNSNNGDISLYGKFYEVKNTGKVKVIKDENKLKSSVNSKFYKLADRKYLIVDRTIQSTNSSLVTSNYLLINLDKSGNATLLNDKVSLKTITPTVIQTSAYRFDIANEKINFGNEDIDLKKIIGSTNEYDEETYDLNAENTKDDDNSTTKNGSGGGASSGSGNGAANGVGNGNGAANGVGNGNGAGNGTGNETGRGTGSGTTQSSSSTYSNNYDSNISDETVDEIINATKNTSVIRITPGINTISIDYVVYDPNNEYKSVYVELENTETLQKNIIYLSKTDTNILISDLTPNIYYNLTFKYTYNEGGRQKEYTFDETGVFTRVPEMILSVNRVVDNKVYYHISLDKKYNITGGTLHLLLNGQVVAKSNIQALGNVSEIGGNDSYFNISLLKLSKNDANIFTVKLVSVSFNTYTINPDITYKFRY